ncbi:iron-containing alcohol dehydrogenase [Desulfotalea psychrophila]|uniref:Probable alcohol dehydrogenase n=1 Tax=Desulfotalea psychrophila (strain LSv54 / DSM 12343) TaxID=177439 RepID=Q6APG1_DESPS|nr:iron-containing alcohol dehydrogenase [Desulfotalea psychrophila]CAG35763.1 probable alcohol dehydrogenase [Desulfotalea psychrophila LSv54]
MCNQTTKPVEFIMPPITVIGSGAIRELPERLVAIQGTKPLVVTDKGMTALGVTATIVGILEKAGMACAVYDETVPNPTDKNVEAGLAAYVAHGCDSIITLGGGSAHDCGKGIGLVATNGGRIHDYEGVNKSHARMPSFIAINTTAGTASEMTRFCIITDSVRKVKMTIVDRRVTPRLAMDDPDLMLGLPPGLTAATGLDALTHAIEAFVSTDATHMTDANAEKAIKLIAKYLRRAVGNGRNVEAREAMCYAQYQAGMAFNNAGLGYVHAMAHQLGGYLNLPHGECNAILLPYVCEFNMIACMDRFAEMADLLGVKEGARTQREMALNVIKAIRDLMDDVAIPPSLTALAAKYGKTVNPEDFVMMAENAMKDACAATNPRRMSMENIIAIYQAVL